MNETKNFEHRRIKNIVIEFIKENYLFWAEDSDLDDNHSLMEGGILDSTGILELSAFLEATFKIIIKDEEFLPENLDTLNAISAYIQRKTNNQL